MKLSAGLFGGALVFAALLAQGLFAMAAPWFGRTGAQGEVATDTLAWWFFLAGLGLSVSSAWVARTNGCDPVPSRFQRVARGSVLFGVALAGASVAVWLSDQAAMRQVTFPLVARVLAAMLSPFGDYSFGANGEVSAGARDGRLLFAISTVKMGSLLLAVGLAALASAVAMGALTAKRLAVGGALLVALMLLRVATEIVLYCELGRVLLPAYPTHLARFADPMRQLPWAVAMVLAVAAAGWLRDARGALAPVIAKPRAVAFAGVVFASMVVFATAFHLRLPTRDGGGVVVVDDRHSDFWASAGRRVSTDWYGDFSTYNLGSLTEYVGHYYPVRVNRSQRYDAESLRDVNVLVLKTPTVDFTKGESEAILEFVHRGGGLVLIGDHTNLMGTSSRLNEFATKAGIAFVFDAVSNGNTGAFSYAPAPRVPHAIQGASPVGMEFMTGCSLRMAAGVDALQVAPSELRIAGDYSQSSFFGNLHNDPRSDLAPVAHAAVGSYGAGTVLAYSDSTTLSSFSTFLYGRADFLLRSIDYAARGGGVGKGMRTIAMMLALCAGLAAMGLLLLRARADMQLLGFVSAVLGLSVGEHAVRAVHDRVWPELAPAVQPARIDFMTRNTMALLPPVLGSSDPSGYSRCYDTFYAAIPRTGRFPQPVQSLAAWTGEQPLIFLEPVSEPVASESKAFHRTLRAGGHALIGVSSENLRIDSLRKLLAGSGISVEFTDEEARTVEIVAGPGVTTKALADGRCVLYEARCERGLLQLVVGSQAWARETIGHSFSVPDHTMAAIYNSIFEVLGRLCPDAGDRRKYTLH